MAHQFVWTAIPRGVSNNKLLLSVVVSPQLEAAANATLPDIAALANWANKVTTAPFGLTVTINGAPHHFDAPFTFVDARLAPDQNLWDALFAPAMQPALAGPAIATPPPVRPFTRSAPGDLVFRSYPVRDVSNGLKERLAASVLSDLAASANSPAGQLLPALLPSSSGSAAVQLAPDATEAERLATLRALDIFNVWTAPAQPTPQETAALQTRLNALKAMALGRMSQTSGQDLTPATLQMLAGNIARKLNLAPAAVPAIHTAVGPALVGSDAFQYALVQVAEFHAVNEAAMAAAMVAGPPEKYDVHQLLKMLTSYPALQRKLGLILDVELPVAPGSIAATGTISAKPSFSPALANSDHLSPMTAYSANAASRTFLPAGRPASSLIKNGFLDVSDGTRFYLETLDVDGAALKTAYTRSKVEGASRTGGIALVFRDKVQFFKDLIASASANNTDLNTITLHAEDLMRGVRIDVRDESAAVKTWKSLCQRRERFQIGRGAKVGWPPAADGAYESEGAVRLAVTKPKDSHAEIKEVQASEVLARWEGWSLCVPLPQSALPKSGDPTSTPAQEHEHEVAVYPTYAVVPNSLPKLRFNRKYRVRARVVDLAGNSVPLDAETDPIKYSCGDPDGKAPLIYRRFEPIEAPTTLVRASFERKSSPARHVDRLVITESVRQDDRAIVPGRASVRFAELHEDHLGRRIDPALGAFEGALLGKDGAFTTIDDPDSPGDHQIAAYRYERQVADKLAARFLPDPLAEGATITLLDRRGFALRSGNNDVAARMSYYGAGRRTWPRAQPFIVALEPGRRAALSSSTPIGALLKERVRPPFDTQALVTLQPGEIARVRMSSTIADAARGAPRTGHHVMALWDITRAHSSGNQTLAALAQQPLDSAAQAGQLPQLTPDTELTLVHAVRQPLLVAMQTLVNVPRRTSETSVTLTYGFELHRCSTGRLDGIAQWKEFLDRVSDATPQIINQSAQVLNHHVALDPDASGPAPFHDKEDETVAGVVHEFGDTKHRHVVYASWGLTRFREYYPPPKANVTAETGFTLDAGEKPLNIKSTARPNAPKVLYIIPSFEWQGAWDDKSRRKISHRVGGLLRVYLDRPWYSSGEGEQLAAVLLDSSVTAATDAQLAGELATKVTRWGSDPLWNTDAVPIDLPTKDSFRGGDKPEDSFTLPELESSPFRFKVVAFTPEFDTVRKLWRADIGLDPGASYTPFIRLALARFQRDSIDNCHLSAPVLTEFAQLAPDRTSCVAYNGSRELTVTVAGFSYRGSRYTPSASSQVRVSLQEQWADLDSDVSWHQLPNQFPPQANVETDGSTTWTFAVTLPRSRKERRYRIVVEECEVLPQDKGLPDPNQTERAERVTYLDVLGV